MTFLDNSNEWLLQSSALLLAIKKRSTSKESLVSLFRAYHSSKGTCAFFPFVVDAKNLAHRMAGLLSVWRISQVDESRFPFEECTAEANLPIKRQNRSTPAVPARASRGHQTFAPFNLPKLPLERVRSLRISESKLDRFRQHIGALLTPKEVFSHLGVRLRRVNGAERIVADDSQSLAVLNSLGLELRGSVMEVRKVTRKSRLEPAPKIAHDVARTVDKKVSTTVCGTEPMVDTSSLERLDAPFTLLLRSAVNHGLEAPALRAAAGRGDCERCQRSFLPGLSTAANLSVNIGDEFVFVQGEERFNLPQTSVQDSLLPKPDSVVALPLSGQGTLHNNQLLPLVQLSSLHGPDASSAPNPLLWSLTLPGGLRVDDAISVQRPVLREVNGFDDLAVPFSAGAILEDGQVALPMARIHLNATIGDLGRLKLRSHNRRSIHEFGPTPWLLSANRTSRAALKAHHKNPVPLAAPVLH